MRRPTESIVKSADKLSWLRRTFWLALLLAACGTPGSATRTPAVVQYPSLIPARLASPTGSGPVATAAATIQATATAEASPILVWWPSALYPADGSPAAKVLQDEIENYQASRTRSVTIRVKRSDGLGGIYQTLRSGSIAAPSAMPDLAIMRRSDLVQSALGKLIEPIDARLLAATDLFPSALALGQVHGVEFGIPYALEIQHVAYRTSILATPPKTFDDLLRAKQRYLFAASASKGVNLTLVAQYMAAGGRLSDEKGAATLDKTPLLNVLRFYEQAAAATVVDAQLLDYSAVAQYWPLFASGKGAIAQVDSTTFLAQGASLSGVAVLDVPLPSGNPIAIVDGWMWVVTTMDPDRQAKALDLISWLLRADQQGQLMREMGILPSQRSALDTWGGDGYAIFARSLLQQPAVPPSDMIDPTVAAAMQRAFEAVLLGRKSPEAAADDALKEVGGSG